MTDFGKIGKALRENDKENKNAREMLEILGYEKIEAINPITEETMDWNHRYIKFDGTIKKEIHINFQTDLVFVNNSFDGIVYERFNTPILTFEEIKAINKTIEEHKKN